MRAALATSAAAAATIIVGLPAKAADASGGAYASLPATSGVECAQTCNDDNLCMAWTFADETCALRATAPASPLEGGALSERALQAGLHINAKPDEPAPEMSQEPLQQPLKDSAPSPDVGAAPALLGGPAAPPDAPKNEKSPT